MHKSTIGIAAIALTYLATSCGTTPCSKDTICTMEYKSITAEIVPPAGTTPAITVDVYHNNHQHFLHTNVASMQGTSNVFEIINDGDMKHMSQIDVAETFRVDVKVNGTVLKSETYELGKDCCHVFKKTGADAINL